MDNRDWDDEDDKKAASREGKRFEFECPECSAVNPYPDGFESGTEVQCYYCGQEFKAVHADGRWKYKAV